VFGWSFYRQGTHRETASADEFMDATLAWFGDADPRLGTVWEKGERLARLIARRRTLLVLDGLEPLQGPQGPDEGRLREPSLQALLRELAAFNKGLCLITTRIAKQESWPGKTRIILGSWTRMPWCVNTSASNCEINGPKPGRKPIGGSTITIERWRRSCLQDEHGKSDRTSERAK
jgi:hypothetical protein